MKSRSRDPSGADLTSRREVVRTLGIRTTKIATDDLLNLLDAANVARHNGEDEFANALVEYIKRRADSDVSPLAAKRLVPSEPPMGRR